MIEAQAIDNLNWNYDGLKEESYLVPTRVVEYFGGSKYTRSQETALKIAASMLKHTWICEYGISFIRLNKRWNQVVAEAMEHARKEIEYLNEHGHGGYDYEISKLQQLLAS